MLLGNADPIIQHLASELGWDLPPPKSATLKAPAATSSRKRQSPQEPTRVENSHIWLYEGAEGGKWLEDVRAAFQEEEEGSDESSDEDMRELSPPPPPPLSKTPSARSVSSSMSRSASAPKARSAASSKASSVSAATSRSATPIKAASASATPSRGTNARDSKKARVR